MLGRRAGLLDVAALGPGRHQVTVPRGMLSPPGIYLAVLRQGEAIARAKVPVTR